MSINIRNVSVSIALLLLLLSIAAGGSIPSGYGQNTPPPNIITSSDIVDLFGNVTDIEEEGRGEDDDDRSNNFPQLNDGGGNNNDNSNDNSNSSSKDRKSTRLNSSHLVISY